MENNNDIQLIKIEAVVREEMFVDVKKALTDIGVNGITAYQVVGCGIQRGMSEYVEDRRLMFRFCRKSSLKLLFLPKNGRKKQLRQSEKQPLRATRVTVKYLPTILNRRLKSVREKQATMQFRLPTLMTDIFLFSYIKKVRTEIWYALFVCKIVYLLIVISSGLTVLSRSLL